MNSKLAFQLGLIFLGFRIFRVIATNILDSVGGSLSPYFPTGTVFYQLSILFIIISIKLKIDEYLETK